MTLKRIVTLLIVLLFAAFVVQNAEVVQVDFLFWKTRASRALVLIGIFVCGLIAGWLSGWLRKKHEEVPSKK